MGVRGVAARLCALGKNAKIGNALVKDARLQTLDRGNQLLLQRGNQVVLLGLAQRPLQLQNITKLLLSGVACI